MKKVLILSFLVAGLFACNQEKATNGSFGEEFAEADVINIADVRAKLGDNEEMPVQVSGTISQKCKSEGCWLTLKENDDNNVMVMFKDHGFNVKDIDCEGKTAVINGRAYWNVVSVEDQKHFAEEDGLDGGDITGPKKELRIEATGVIIK